MTLQHLIKTKTPAMMSLREVQLSDSNPQCATSIFHQLQSNPNATVQKIYNVSEQELTEIPQIPEDKESVFHFISKRQTCKPHNAQVSQSDVSRDLPFHKLLSGHHHTFMFTATVTSLSYKCDNKKQRPSLLQS